MKPNTDPTVATVRNGCRRRLIRHIVPNAAPSEYRRPAYRFAAFRRGEPFTAAVLRVLAVLPRVVRPREMIPALARSLFAPEKLRSASRNLRSPPGKFAARKGRNQKSESNGKRRKPETPKRRLGLSY